MTLDWNEIFPLRAVSPSSWIEGNAARPRSRAKACYSCPVPPVPEDLASADDGAADGAGAEVDLAADSPAAATVTIKSHGDAQLLGLLGLASKSRKQVWKNEDQRPIDDAQTWLGSRYQLKWLRLQRLVMTATAHWPWYQASGGDAPRHGTLRGKLASASWSGADSGQPPASAVDEDHAEESTGTWRWIQSDAGEAVLAWLHPCWRHCQSWGRAERRLRTTA